MKTSKVNGVASFQLKPTQQGTPLYNAYERDIAVLNLFFGDSTVFGKWLGLREIEHLMFRIREIAEDDRL